MRVRQSTQRASSNNGMTYMRRPPSTLPLPKLGLGKDAVRRQDASKGEKRTIKELNVEADYLIILHAIPSRQA